MDLDHAIEHLKVLRLQPGDILVLQVPFEIDDMEAAELRRLMIQNFPGFASFVIGSGAELGVVRGA